MAEKAVKHPYAPGPGGIIQAVSQFRKSFPPSISADTLKKLSIAPNNESYILNVLRFIGVIDDEGKKTPQATSVFSQHEDADFQKGLSALVEEAYADLFELHGPGAWGLSGNSLIAYFRTKDHSSAIVGKRQAMTFQTLVGLSGRGEVPASKASTGPKKEKEEKKKAQPTGTKAAKVSNGGPLVNDVHPPTHESDRSGVGLTVRIEINLPASGDQETYDRIFKSIRENLLSGK